MWQFAGLAFFAYVAVVLAWQGPRGRSVARVATGIALGALVVVLSWVVDLPLLTNWIWPPLVLLLAYWTSGLLFIAPSARQERALGWLDARLNILWISARTPRILGELFESAYAGVYLLVPMALILQGAFSAAPNAARFWDVILITDFVCFGALPWVQTRPPRALEAVEPWVSSVRQLNLRVLGAASIQVNTFPSGHAAEALAAFLLVLDAPAFVAVPMLLGALAVSAGAVLGRYHFLVDALAGWVVALAVVATLG
jgi:membrane-associated phospholipid phosphatase